jgi:hypothetical protein
MFLTFIKMIVKFYFLFYFEFMFKIEMLNEHYFSYFYYKH